MVRNPYYSPLRYPGGKRILVPSIKEILKKASLDNITYIEPYVGGGGVALNLLFTGIAKEIHINDFDFAIYSFWKAILEQTDRFIEIISNIPVTIDEWHKQKEVYENKDNNDYFKVGIATFFLNRTNRSGILKGGVMGGQEQKSKYKIDCRFNKLPLLERIKRIGSYKSKIHVYNFDALELLREKQEIFSNDSFTFLDPPYYNKGAELYENHYSHNDHLELASTITNILLNKNWILTYDNTPEIINMYEEFHHDYYSLKYTAGKKKTGKEIMVLSKSIAKYMD